MLSMKFEQIIASKLSVEREIEAISTQGFLSQISEQRTHKDLILKMKDALPEFLGYSDSCVLFYAKDEQELYTVSYLGISNKKEGKLAELMETPNDAFIRFPASIGITGAVFKGKKIYMSNKASKESKFSPDVDNINSVPDVKNFLIAPIFGEDKNTPIGIVQLYNRVGKDEISIHDEERFKMIQNFLGTCAENVNDISIAVKYISKIRASVDMLSKGVESQEIQKAENMQNIWSMEHQLGQLKQMIGDIITGTSSKKV